MLSVFRQSGRTVVEVVVFVGVVVGDFVGVVVFVVVVVVDGGIGRVCCV